MKIIGHRGAKGLAPDNTLEAFQVAIDCGVDMIETDVRITKDGQLVLAHDDSFVQNGQTQLLADTPYSTLKKTRPSLVTLDEAIRFVDRRVRLMIEVKPGVPTDPVAKLLHSYLANGWSSHDFMFNSQHYPILRDLYAALPSIDRIIQGNWSGMRVQYLARKLHTPYILLDQRYLWWGYVYLVSKKYKLVTYTYMWWPGDPLNHFKSRRWQRFGLWGVVTDYPDRYHLPRKQRRTLPKRTAA